MFKNRKIPHWIFLYVAAILLVACAVNGLMYLAIPTLPDLNAPTWLGFWGSYLGGAIGCIPAFLALQHSLRQSEIQRKDIEKDRHLANLPVLDNQILHIKKLSDVSRIGFSSINTILVSSEDPKGYSINDATVGILREILEANSTDVLLLQVKNIGHGPALSVLLHFETTSEFPLGTLAEGETLNLILSLVRRPDSTYPLKFSFRDMLDWKHSQYHQVYIGLDLALVSPISAPVLES